jgi:UDP-glucose 4-epimerase
MRALITGGAGFIGSHLVEALLAAGHAVTTIDNLSTGSLRNVEHLLNQPRFELVIDDVLNEHRMADLIHQADVVFHLAAAVGVKWIIDHPLLSIRTNLRATEVVLEQASRNGTKVLLASTSEVYGKNDGGPLREDSDSVIGPTRITRWLYANTKATDEFLAYAYHRELSLPMVIVRFFNTVGPRQTGQYGMVVPRFVRQALRNEPITIYGDGSQCRCFTYVGDTVRALIRLAETQEAVGEVFNVGNEQEITILELAQMIIAMTGSSSPLEFIPYERAYESGFEDMHRRVPDVSKLKGVIGYAPNTRLKENLQRTIHHMLLQEPGLRERPKVKVDHARVTLTTVPISVPGNPGEGAGRVHPTADVGAGDSAVAPDPAATLDTRRPVPLAPGLLAPGD